MKTLPAEEAVAVRGLAAPRGRASSKSTVSGLRRGLAVQASRQSLLVWFLRLLVPVAFVTLWYLAVDTERVNELFVSRPSEVWRALQEYFSSGDIWRHGYVTLKSTLIGFVVGSALGVLVGMIFALAPLLDRVFSVYLTAINAMPRVALAPLFILWFGIGPASKIWFSISLVFFILLGNTEAGVKGVDRELLLTTQAMGASKRQQFLKVVIPGSVPTIFAGLRLGLVYALLGVVFGEMLASRDGLGQQVSFYAGSYNTAGVFATVVILAAMSVLLSGILAAAERWLLRWQ